jgi:hypothetical protein
VQARSLQRDLHTLRDGYCRSSTSTSRRAGLSSDPTAEIGYGLTRSPKLWHHPWRGVVVVMLLVLWVAALVLWRRRWAWVLMLVVTASAVVAPLWEWNGVLVYAFNVVTLGLLISPGMRRYVGAYWRRP